MAGVMERIDESFRMGHEAEDLAGRVGYPGDIQS